MPYIFELFGPFRIIPCTTTSYFYAAVYSVYDSWFNYSTVVACIVIYSAIWMRMKLKPAYGQPEDGN